jgi:hypothetical protein
MGTARGITEPTLVFRVREQEQPALEVRVNFGVFAGRNATQAEIDDLARTLNDVVESFSIVAEERHEFGGSIETSVRQIVIEIDGDNVGEDIDVLCERIVARAEQWASDSIRERSDLGDLGSEL